MATNTEPPANSLGLDFKDDAGPETKPATSTSQEPAEEKRKPYVNPERVKTGGNQRDKLSEEALSERMARMREQNEKIKQRRLDVQADEEAFKMTQESERVKLAQSRKIQEGVDRTREQNAKRKLDKQSTREWDSMKVGQISNRPPPKADDDEKPPPGPPSSPPTAESGGWVRGGGPRGSPSPRNNRGGRGRGGGRGGPDPPTSTAPVSSSPTAATSTSESA
ncbi:hypothetical protein FB45DRAFT_912135 [Roridomyces roridus]|uniref:Uncharacterized protein n=1 Tax=Roridomyces roridus TaxID=1738132 RepID=A0AAD7FQ91_9AGAR|nr:hypothetical protein FB45DRAFT_912135 [Roridomyces roridus]